MNACSIIDMKKITEFGFGRYYDSVTINSKIKNAPSTELSIFAKTKNKSVAEIV